MPYMKQCDVYTELCKEPFEFCTSTLPAPAMKMYFHWGIRDYVLFESWVPTGVFTYFFALSFCLLFGIFYEYLVHLGSKFEISVAKAVDNREPTDSELPLLDEREVNVSRDQSRKLTVTRIRIARSIFRFIILFAGYICMLLAMTFNAGYFVTIILGVSIGTFLFNDSPVVIEHCR